MAAKSSVNENKVPAMIVSASLVRSGRNHGKAWKSGRGEVSQPRVVISPANLSLFSSQIFSLFSVCAFRSIRIILKKNCNFRGATLFG